MPSVVVPLRAVEGVTGTPDPVRRRRRTPEEAEAEIVAAAEQLLRERPFRDMTVDEVMRRTELSRPSFYVYFRDRHQLVLRVVERIREEIMQIADMWFRGGRDGPAEIRASMDGVVVAFREHGPVLRALSDAAADDARVEAVYAALVEAFVGAIAEHVERELAVGNALPLEPRETAKALTWMAERYLVQELGSGNADVATERAIRDTLVIVFSRTIYGRDS